MQNASNNNRKKATGLFGSMFPNMSADTQNRLAVGFSGLSAHPNQGVMHAAQQRIANRREPTQPEQEPEMATGILGSMFPNMTADRQDRIVTALSGLSMHPNQAGMHAANNRINARRRAAALMMRRAEENQRRARAGGTGIPAFRHGTNFAPGGMALVGEDGPELVNLPRGSQVIPNPRTPPQQGATTGNRTVDHLLRTGRTDLVQAVQGGQMSASEALQMTRPQMAYDERSGPAANPGAHQEWLRSQTEGYMDPPEPDEYMRQEMGEDAFRRYQGMTREQRLDFMNDPANGFVPPAPQDMRSNLGLEANARPQSSFLPGAEYRTADMSAIEPSGVGERSALNSAARSFQGFMKSLDDYERMFANGGSTAWPGKRKDELSTAHRDLQMLAKELYNLGVLNGPDLMLMDQVLLDPTSITGNVKDALGISDMEERIPANIKEVRRMMTNRMTPALQQLGINPDDLMPKQEQQDLTGRSTEELMQMLTGG